MIIILFSPAEVIRDMSDATRRKRNLVVGVTLSLAAFAIYQRSMAVITQNDFKDIDRQGNKIDPNAAAAALRDSDELAKRSSTTKS